MDLASVAGGAISVADLVLVTCRAASLACGVAIGVVWLANPASSALVAGGAAVPAADLASSAGRTASAAVLAVDPAGRVCFVMILFMICVHRFFL